MQHGYEIEQHVLIEATPELVWPVLVTPASIRQWLGVEVVSEWKEGSAIEFNFEYQGKRFNDKGKIIALSQNRVLAYSYWSAFSGLHDSPENYSEITFSIRPDSHGVLLSLSHTKIGTETMYEHSQANWAETLAVIKRISERSN